MAKKNYKMKWREEDYAKIYSTVRSFNAKRTRILKKSPEMENFLPPKITSAELIEMVYNRNDFNRTINSYKRFLRKGAEAPVQNERGTQATKWEVREGQIKTQQVNRRRKVQLAKLMEHAERSEKYEERKANLMPRNYNFNKFTPAQWEDFRRWINNQTRGDFFDESARAKQYVENYAKGLINTFGYDSKVEDCIAILRSLSNEQVEQLSTDIHFDIDYIYDPVAQEQKLDNIYEGLYWLQQGSEPELNPFTDLSQEDIFYEEELTYEDYMEQFGDLLDGFDF